MTTSKFEELIDALQDYVDSCKYKPFSQSIIYVDKEEIDELIRELRLKTPEEVRRYQKIISNKDEILGDANQKANEIISLAQQHSDNMVNDHEIMQQAYAQANEIVAQAKETAQDILDKAVMQANDITLSAMQYTDDSLANIQSILEGTIESYQARSGELVASLSQYLQSVNADRAELHSGGAQSAGGEGYAEQNPADQGTAQM